MKGGLRTKWKVSGWLYKIDLFRKLFWPPCQGRLWFVTNWIWQTTRQWSLQQRDGQTVFCSLGKTGFFSLSLWVIKWTACPHREAVVVLRLGGWMSRPRTQDLASLFSAYKSHKLPNRSQAEWTFFFWWLINPSFIFWSQIPFWDGAASGGKQKNIVIH